MRQDLKVSMNAPSSLRVDLAESEPLSVQLTAATIKGTGTSDYEKLKNKPSINEVELIGAQTSESLHIVSENTTAGWAQTPSYAPKRGEFIIYTDYNGGTAIKVGDGQTYVADLPFVGDSQFEDHINNTTVHITAQERAFWNDKLNCLLNEPNEELIINRN